MSGVPQFAASVISAGVTMTVANPNRDGTGTVSTLYTAGVNGARVDDIAIKARVTTTAGMVRLFLHDGANYYLIREVLVSAITASATVAAFETALQNLGWVLASGWSIRCCSERAEAINVAITRGGAF